MTHSTITPCHWGTPFPSFKCDVARHQQRCCAAPFHPEHFSLPTTTNEPAQVPPLGPTGKHHVQDLCCNTGRTAEHLWDGFQPCRWEILQCLGHSDSYISWVKVLKHMAKETPKQKKSHYVQSRARSMGFSAVKLRFKDE